MIRFALALCLLPFPAVSITLDMPVNAEMTLEDTTAPDSYAMPIGPWTEGSAPVTVATGEVRKQSWRVKGSGLTTLQLLQPLREQLIADGFEVVFSCTDNACGGFDFRFGMAMVPAPAMHVDLGNYRYVALRRSVEDEPELVSLLASRSSSAGFVQVIHVGPPQSSLSASPNAPAALSGDPAGTDDPAGTLAADLAGELERTGRFVLADLTFETGSAQLGNANFVTLERLAAYLIANPDRTVALVGHTDAVGTLESNIALSKRRAQSAVERLVSAYNIPSSQLAAEGMGYLAPISNNLTAEGREANRRVEVILTVTD